MKDVKDYCPSDKKDWRNWLVLNHEKKDAVWLIFYKTKSPKHNLSWSESVNEALCFGWIDSTKRTIDNEKYKQYFTKRKSNSIWSRINKEKVKVLIDQELMMDQGFKSIEMAKENGSWTILDSVEALIIPADLIKEFDKRPGSLEYFESLSKSAKKILLSWIVLAKRADTKHKRTIEIAENASNQLKPKQFR